ncbi:serine/threonine-protein kinase [Pseudonocardia sp. CA-107938]|uniref:serine/threonine-protein kinase n=1 Tax=Pseudonocardia sp. CA-107938 TaxID=3240021 RepID=UPI003D8B455E
MSGEEFGPYRLLSRLGAGGMGEVWRARDTRTDREIAIKRLHPRLAGDPTYVAGFRREAALVAKLNHPAIVPIHSYGEIDDLLYIEMPLLAGTDLAALVIREGPLEPARAVEVIAQVAEALDTAHAAGLVHRDVKPSNVMVQARRRGDFVHLIDFGIARPADATTGINVGLVGTLDYMSPERFDNAGDLRGDVYALAGVLFYALTGQKPFAPPPDVDADVFFYVNAHLHRPPPRPSDYAPASVRPRLGGLDAVVARGMAKDPAERYPSAGELAAAAHAALDASPSTDAGAARTVRMQSRFAAPPTPLPRTQAAPPVVARVAPVAAPADRMPADRMPADRMPADRLPPARSAPPAAPPRAAAPAPPASSGARRRRIQLGIGGLLLTVAVIAAALVWANLPRAGTDPARPTGTAAPPITERTLTGHTNWVFGLATAQLDGRTVVISGSGDNTIRLWDPATGAPVGSTFTGHTGPVAAVVTAQLEGRTVVVSGSWDKTVRVWDLATGTPVGAPFTGHTGPLFAVATAQLEGRTVVISGSNDNTVRVWDLATGRPVGSPFTGHTTAVAAVTTAELDGRTVVISASNDGTVRVWDLATGTPVGDPFTGHTGLVQAVATAQLDGRTVVISGGDDGVRVWDLGSRAPVGSPFTGHTKRVVALTTTQLGGRTVVVSGAWDNTVRVSDLATGAAVGTPFTGHTDFVCVVATVQTGTRTAVLSGGRDNTVRVWDLDARARP